ncbi:MAG: HD-GYP domain-containing protein, partial [Thermodesulfobacteriota bacterium]
MTPTQLLSMVLVLPGICFLVAAAVSCGRTHQQVPKALRPKWRALTGLILCFVAGYAAFLAIQFRHLPLPQELLTSMVFLGGAVFVFLVISLSRLTIIRVRETDLELSRANVALIQKNRELSEENLARQQAEARARLRLQYLTTLHAIDMVITGSLDLRFTMKLFLEQTIPRLGMDAGAMLLLNPHTQILEHGADWGFVAADFRQVRERLGEGSAGIAAMERRMVHIPTLGQKPNEFIRHELLGPEGMVAYFAVPLIAKGQVRGVFEVFSRKELAPEQEWFEFLEALSIQAALAIDNATLFRKLQESNIELTLAYDTTIEGWANALELRDSETEGHTRRVTDLTMKCACAAGLREEEMDHVRRGALLHDIGKMAIPDAILMKTGPLTEEEQRIMRQHPVHAYNLLSPIHYLR